MPARCVGACNGCHGSVLIFWCGNSYNSYRTPPPPQPRENLFAGQQNHNHMFRKGTDESCPRITQEVNGSGNDFSVMIVAAGSLPEGGIVHAIAVTQPVQSWTVLRSHDEFKAVADSLSLFLSTLPPCPAAVKYNGDINSIVNSRNALQDWLNQILRYPGARESPDVRSFLTFGANMIPPQFEDVSWNNFTHSPNTSAHVEAHNGNSTNLDDMEMADMFEDEGVIDGDDDDDVDDFVLASIRYKAIDEPITAEDELDLTAEVEMVDDLGSLAQSLGASQLGMSLRLQAEIATRNKPPPIPPPHENQAVGVRLSFPVPRPKEGEVGGLSNVMEQAKEQRKVQGIGDSFYQKRPVSAPKLDSFKIVKVIGKGSFGTHFMILNSNPIVQFPHERFCFQEKYFSSEKRILGKCML